MDSEIPCAFNQKRGLTICAKGDNAQNQSGGDHAADQRALAGESSIGERHTSDLCWQPSLPAHISDCWPKVNLSTFRTTGNSFRLNRPSRGKLPVYMWF